LKVVGIASPNEKSVKGIWYHGTSKKNADKIMKEGIIKPSQDTKYNLDIPRFDAVYITKNLETAQHYAEREGVVLKVRVEDTGNLVPDEDTITEAFQEETDPLHEKVKAVWWDSYKKEQANLEDAYPWLAEQKSVIINSWMEWHNKYDRIPEFPPSQGIQKGWQGPFRGPQGGKFWTNPKRVDATGKPDKVYQSEKPEPQYKPQDDPLYQRALKMKTKVPFDKRLKLLKMGVDRFPPMDASNIKVRLRFKPKKEPAMTWRDSKGRAQAAYTKVFLEANAAKKWTRVMKYDAKLEFQQRRLQNLVGRTKFGTPENQAAVIASVISLTGLRVGGAVAAKSRHFGVSTLRGTHVKALKNGGVALTFTGKSGVKINQHITPGKTAKALLRYAGKAKHLPMFSIGPHKPRALLPGKMKLKDFRTILATRWAKEELEKEFAEYIKHDYRWSKPEQIKKMIMAASKRVAKKLHNTPSVARGSYIHPEVIEEFIEKIND
jgi:DNA topoisomerase-1